MECPSCGCGTPEGANFCFNCGSQLSIAPPGSPPPSNTFDEKLTQLERYLPRGIADKILSHKDKLEGERRQVTVMFCDMQGYTPLVDRLDTEEAYQVMDQVYEILIHGVHEFGGTVNEMTGDGIMALFGAPMAIEDAPQRALHSALAIHRQIADFSRRNASLGPIRMRIGIHTGPVIVGTLGNDLKVEFKAVGDTVNLASRMEQLAEAGTTYTTAETFKLTRHLFRFVFVGDKIVKGKKESVGVYQVVSARQDVHRPRLGSERMIYSALIGRQRELERIEQQLQRLVNGQGAVINIIGEAGIGKSRLVAELRMRAAVKGVFSYEGRSVSIGRNLSFHPIIDLLRQWAGIKHDDDEGAALRKLESALRKLYREEYDIRLPFVASLMGLKLGGEYEERVRGIEGESLEKLILENVRELLIRASQSVPLMIITEDLHWSDMSSIELLESLFDLSRTHRVVFINVFRPDYKETGERIIANLTERDGVDTVEIRLGPLDASKSETLIGNMLNHSMLDYAIVEQIVTRAGGNPYFIEEIVRSMIDDAVLVVRNGRFEATAKIAAVDIPNTINDVLMARIDQLAEPTREVMMIASIIGRSFLYRVIKEVAAGIADIDVRLSQLKEMQLVSEEQATGEVEYRFKHGLAQETVYLSMLPAKRKKIHLRVAAAIEKLFADKRHEFYGELSYHFNQGEDFEKAESYMLMAGDEAMQISASNEALNYYKTAMELYIKKRGDAVERHKIAELEENIALAFFSKGNFVEAVNYFERSLKNYGIKRYANPILVSIGLLFNLASIVKSLYLPSFKKRRPPSDHDLRIMNLKFKLAMSLAYVDINRVFIDNIRNVPPSFKLDIRNAPVYVDALIGTSALFAVTGISFKLSRRLLDYVDRRVFNANGETTVPKNFYWFIESLYNCLAGKWHHRFNENYVAKALAVGEVSYAAGYLFWLACSRFERGDLEEARNITDNLHAIGKRYNYEHSRFDYYFLKVKLLISANELAKAATVIDEAFNLLVKYGLDMPKIDFYGLKIRILVLQKDLDAARKMVSQGDDLILKIGKKSILPNFYGEYLIGKLMFCIGRLEESIALDHKTDFKHHDHTTLAVVKQSIRHFKRRTATGRTEAYRLVGRYFWLVNARDKASKWWHKSIQTGERLKADIELAKTLDEVESMRGVSSG